MIPKIIHNIWIQGYENLPNENKIYHLNIKKLNPDWDFMIWDDGMITNLLQKYPKIYDIYKKTSNYSGSIDNNIIKSDIARYIIMKEYGGLYFDIEFKCRSSFDDIFLNETNEDNENNSNLNSKNNIYISSSQVNYWNLWNFINPFQREKYCSCFMGMDKNHPIWDTVFKKLTIATTKQHIHNALDISLQQIENDAKKKGFKIVLLNKVNGNYYQCNNNNTSCYKQLSHSSLIFNFFNCYFKQFIMFIIAILIIIAVEYLYMHNAIKFGPVNFIPGIPGSAPPSNTILQKKKVKRLAKN
jgi:mannosyltransferase OCH1-like enzyme